MKGIVIVWMIVTAALGFWGWSKSSEAEAAQKKCAELEAQVKQLDESFIAERRDHAAAVKKLTAECAAATEKAVKSEKTQADTAPANAVAVPVNASPAAALAKPVTLAQTVAQPSPEEIAKAARAKAVKDDIINLRMQLTAAKNNKTNIESKIKNAKNQLMTGGGREKGWYYIESNGSHSQTYSMSEIKSRDPRRRIGYVSASKTDVREKEAAKFYPALRDAEQKVAELTTRISSREREL